MLFAPMCLWAVTVVAAGDPQDAAAIVVSAEDVASRRFPSVSAELTSLALEYQPIASALGLSAYFGADPPVVLFGPDDSREGAWLVHLAQRTVRYFRAQYAHDARPTRAMAQFWLNDAASYGQLLDWLAAKAPYLAPWAESAKRLKGFAIYQPELVCVLESEASRKGINLENNLVHLTGHLALYQCEGTQPFWLREGVALSAESTVLGTLYSFCAGGRFVPMARRGWWRRKLDTYWLDKATLDLDRLLALNQREFDHEGSLLAFSVVRYLAGHRAEGFARLLAGIRDERDAHLAENRNYEVPPATQKALLDQCLGGAWVFDAVTTAKSWDWGVTTQMERDWLALARNDATDSDSDAGLDGIEIIWRGKRCRGLELPRPARDSVSEWAAWARRHRYQPVLSETGNVLLLLPAKDAARAARLMREADATCSLVDERVLGAPAQPTAKSKPKPTAPETPPARKAVFDDCVTLIEFDSAADYASALDVIQEEYPYDTALRESLQETSGFLLFTPLVAGWVESPSGVEEWKPEHELINRLAQLLVVRHLGRPPLWFLTGAGWYAEYELKNKIYSFPYRNEFVAVEEHDGWANHLKEMFKSKSGEALTIDAFARIAPGSFHRDEAALAWGMVTFLSQKYPGAAGRFLSELASRNAGDPTRPAVDCSDAPAAAQLEALVKQTSGECLDEAAAFFRAGCRKR